MRSPVQAVIRAAAVALLLSLTDAATAPRSATSGAARSGTTTMGASTTVSSTSTTTEYLGCECDMYILLEDSMRLGADNFTALRDFAASFAGGYLVSQKDIKIGIVSFGETELTGYKLEQATDTRTVVRNIGTLDYVPDDVVNWKDTLTGVFADLYISSPPGQRQTVLLFVKGYAHDEFDAELLVGLLKGGGRTVVVLSLGATEADRRPLNATASDGCYVNVDNTEGLTEELREELDGMLPACHQSDCPAATSSTTSTSTSSMAVTRTTMSTTSGGTSTTGTGSTTSGAAGSSTTPTSTSSTTSTVATTTFGSTSSTSSTTGTGGTGTSTIAGGSSSTTSTGASTTTTESTTTASGSLAAFPFQPALIGCLLCAYYKFVGL